jgi:outer membrane lipoprotein SlyB
METFLLIVGIGFIVTYFVRSQKRKLQQQQSRALDENDYMRLQKKSQAYSFGGGAAIWGAIIGSFIGVAGFGGAISGIFPGAIVGGIVGYLFKNQHS